MLKCNEVNPSGVYSITDKAGGSQRHSECPVPSSPVQFSRDVESTTLKPAGQVVLLASSRLVQRAAAAAAAGICRMSQKPKRSVEMVAAVAPPTPTLSPSHA